MQSSPVRKVREIFGRVESLKDLPYILEQANPKAKLSDKIAWLESLMQWIRSDTDHHHEFDSATGQLHTARVRFLLQVLERNPQWKVSVSENLRAIFRETSAVQLFCETGLAQEAGVFSEGADRVLRRLLPVPPKDNELAEIFSRLFRDETDSIWLRHLAPETFHEILALIQYENPGGADLFDNWKHAIHEALLILGANVGAQGLHPAIRERLPGITVASSPFLVLNQKLNQFSHELARSPATTPELREVSAGFAPIIDDCRARIQEVLKHLEVSGVSVNLVYRLEMLSGWLVRIETLLKLLVLEHLSERHQIVLQFAADLIDERLANSTLTQLVSGNLHLLSRKIVERTGASGEHYITRTREEYMAMLRSAAGGGLLTVGTTVMKFAVTNLKLPFFFEGLFNALNYSGSFVMMQLMGFTLATKQPSMTASALAGKLKEIHKSEDVHEFVTEVIRITRSQFAAAVGNVGTVVPCAIILEFTIRGVFRQSVVSTDTANYVLHSLDPIHSLTIPLAALTGVLLWFSSLFAGWVENWVVYRKLPEAITLHRQLNRIFGKDRCEGLSHWFLHNVSGISGVICLGFLLAFTPIVGKFFGLPLDTRHVTLSSGSLAFAVCSVVRAGIVDWWAVAAAAGGIVIIGVSFALALAVAARARNVKRTWILYLMKIVWHRLRRSPKEFFLPPKDNT
ncbi:MAG: hypothetical protein ABL958_08640 [Bdellovibrionia bacterium]